MTAVKGAPKKRRLSDLYVVGKEVMISDGTGDPVELYMRRPNPFEHEEALRDGNASRARVTLKMRDRKTDEYEILEADIANIGNPYKLVDFLLGENQHELYTRAYTEVSNSDKWATDSLIESIQENLEKWDLLEEPLTDAHEDWEDYQRALEAVKEFNGEIEAKVDVLREDKRAAMLEEPESDIRDQVRKALIDKAAGLAFFREYRIGCIYYATREPSDKSKRYFTSKQEIRELPYELQVQLLRAYDDLDMSRDEIKNSPSADPLSLESALPEVETLEPSGLENATV